ncbi:MAG: DNA polymerase III subunit delta [Candidatus Omnitrophota bacterium]|nr:MAG: DNA polymerase III subunit delta [Candidatus Omnitrophota bacterium]
MVRKETREGYFNLYLIVGEDKFLKEEEIGKIRKGIFSSSVEEGFNYHIFDAQEKINIEEVIGLSRLIPWQARHRLIVVNNIEFLNVKDKKRLLSFFDTLPSHTILVLTSSKMREKEEVYQGIKKRRFSKVIHLSSPFFKIEQWIRERIKKEGKEIDAEEVRFIRERVGKDRHTLIESIDKLLSYIGDKKKIEKRDIEEMITEGNLGSASELLEALRERDKKSIEILHQLFLQRQKPERLLGLLFWEIERWGKNRKTDRLGRKRIKLFLQTDLMLKTSFLDAQTALELLLIRLCEDILPDETSDEPPSLSLLPF